MTLATRGAALGYALAFAGVAALVLLHGYAGLPRSADVLFLAFLCTITLAGWVGGFGPALLGTLLASLLGAAFALPPERSFALDSIADQGRVLVLMSSGVLVALLARWGHDRGRLARVETGRVQASEERFRLAGQAVQGVLYDLDVPSGRFWASEGLERVIGAPSHPEGHRHEWWLSRMHPDDREWMLAEVARLEDDRAPTWTGRYRVRHEDGHWVHVWDSARLLRDDEGRLVRVVGYSMDVSREVEAAASLRASEERLRLAIEALGLAYWDFDLKSGNLAWSESHFALFGCDPQRDGPARMELWRRCVHPDDLDRVVKGVGAAMTAGAPYNTTYRIRRADTGDERTLTALGRALPGEDGRPSRFVGVVFDITDQATAQEALRQRMEESERLLDVLPAAVWYAQDAECRVVTANAQATRITAPASDVNVSALVPEAERGWRRFLQNGQELAPDAMPLQRAIAEGAPLQMEFSVERGDGAIIDLLGGSAPLFDAQGRPRGAVAAFVDISARREAERAARAAQDGLASSLALLDTLIEHAPVAMAFVDRDFRYARVNALAVAYAGVARERLLGHTIAEVPEGLCSSVEPLCRRVLETGEAVIGVELAGASTIALSEPAPGTFLASCYPVRGDAGEVLGFGLIISDITTRKEAETRLRESEQRLRELADAMPQIVFVNRADGSIEFVNRQWEFFTGRVWSSDSAVHECVHPDDRSAMLDAWATSRELGEPFAVEFRLRLADGTYRWFLSRAVPVRDDQGAILRWYGTSTDIDGQKRAQTVLQQAEARQRTLADAALRVNASLSVAQPLERTLQLVADLARDILGAHQGLLSSMREHEGGAVVHVVSLSEKYARWRTYDEPTTGTGIYSLVCRTNRPMRLTQAELEAHPRFTRFSDAKQEHPPLRGWLAVPMVGRDGRNLGVLQFSDRCDGGEFTAEDEAVAMQMAAMASVAMENWTLVQQIRETDRRKDEFLATLAHELRNPLAPIGNSIELLRQSAGESAVIATARETMERQMTHLVHLVDDLLDASRITNGKLTLRREHVPLTTVLLQAAETARPALERARQTLDLRLPSSAVWLDADPTRLTQVFANLFNNAAKFGGPDGVVTVETALEDGQAVVRVRDRGIGIPPEKLGLIFEMFSQVDRGPDRAAGGLGIGLALVRRLVEMHGGRVDAASPGEGQGSTFTVRLPRVDPPSSAQPLAEVDGARSAGRRILVADDNRDSADSMAALLGITGHETRATYDGAEAVAAAERWRPDVVLLDLGMPRLDGHEAARRIRACLGPRVLLVAMTGWGDELSRQRTREAGFDAHLTKPVELPRLLALLAGQ